MIKKIIPIFLIGALFLFTPSLVLARDATVCGKVLLKQADKVDVPIPGVVVYRLDSENAASLVGTIAVTNENGEYCFTATGATNVTNGSNNCGREGHDGETNVSCRAVKIGNNPEAAACMGHYHCGFSCSNNNVPEKWLAYFPKNYDSAKLPVAGVYIKPNDMKGGGSWSVGSINNEGDMEIRAGNGNWAFSANNFGQVTYGANEWLIAEMSSNHAGGRADIYWIPGSQPKFQCLSLTSTVTTNTLKPGDQTAFTCSSDISSDYVLKHYNYRIHTPANDATIGSDTYWSSPTGWLAAAGATPLYTIPQSGSYKVQCQACRNPVAPETEPVCTAWGQASAN